MKYKLIIFDIDGTITRHISSWRYIHEKLGIWDKEAFSYQEQFLSGKINYRRFCELDAYHWKGMSERKIIAIFKNVEYSKNAASSIRRLKKLGFKLAAISTGLQFMSDRIKREFGFDYVLSNRLVVRKGIVTGNVKINIVHGAKSDILYNICRTFKIKPAEAISIGDSDGDIPLAKASGYSIAFNSSSEELSQVVDYDCKTKDFKEVMGKILSISL